MNQAIHSVDLLTWLMGPVVEVQARIGLLAHERIAVEDVAMATVAFANGAMGVIEASTAIYPGYLKRIEIHGSAGSAVMEEEDIVKWDFAKPAKRDAAIQQKMAETQEHRRRSGRPEGHRPPRPRPAVPGRGQRHQEGRQAADRRPRRPPLGRDHPGDLQGGRNGPARQSCRLPSDPVLKARKSGVAKT